MACLEHDIPSCVLVNVEACSLARQNATTAWSLTSTGMPISVTFCTAPAPDRSFFSVYCPGISPSYPFSSPTFISEDADLVVLRVPRDGQLPIQSFSSDYFVYRVNHQCPTLHRLPNPFPATFQDNEIAVLSCGDGKYVVASLQIELYFKPAFRLYLYRSTRGTWSSQLLSLEEPLRDKVCPIPESAERQIFHKTSKVIVLGDGTVGWVDLWRGVILCDVLSERPMLRDLPLPLPAKCNLDAFLNCSPTYFRDITVNQRKDTIKYVEMEITPPKKPFRIPSILDVDDPDSGQSHSTGPRSWTATTWKMPIPVASWNAWRPYCSVSLPKLSLPPVGNHELCMTLGRLLKTRNNTKQEITRCLGRLCMAYPVLTLADDDVIYFWSKSTCMGNIKAVVAVDAKKNILQGLGAIDDTSRCFLRNFQASGISRYTTVTGASLGQAGPEHMSEANKDAFGTAHSQGADITCSSGKEILSTKSFVSFAGRTSWGSAFAKQSFLTRPLNWLLRCILQHGVVGLVVPTVIILLIYIMNYV